MTTVYTCQDLRRKALVEEMVTLNGIDYIEVGDPSQTSLHVFFLNPLPGQIGGVPAAPVLGVDNIRISGGIRIAYIDVVGVVSNGKVLTVHVKEPGDFSEYTLSIVVGEFDGNPPDGFDPVLSSARFSFKSLCETDFDCVSDVRCTDDTGGVPKLNYLAKDYQSFRQLMLNRLSISLPDWNDRNPADPYVALVESLAYKADQLSYFQDAVGTEAYLNTARSRVSLRRHARLMDYFVDEGCNARSFAYVQVAENSDLDMSVLPTSTPFIAAGQGGDVQVSTEEVQRLIQSGNIVFESMHDVELRSAHNRLSFYTWSDSQCYLPKGAVFATLLKNPDMELRIGDFLVLKQVLSPVTGIAADVNPELVHVVRLTGVEEMVDPLDDSEVVNISWHDQDALPYDLVISAEILDKEGMLESTETAVVFGNIVAVDHGYSMRDIALDIVEDELRYRPLFLHQNISYAAAYDSECSVQSVLTQDEGVLPILSLDDGEVNWQAQRDLLSSDRFAPDFVVETEGNGDVYLRFGDGEFGQMPQVGVQFKAFCRIGNGIRGNIGRGVLSKISYDVEGVEGVTNFIPAQGGRNAESKRQIRQRVSEAYKTQKRAVTPEDYEAVLTARDDVQGANARIQWTGSWHTAFITVDRVGGLSVQDDTDFKNDILGLLRTYRLAGYDLELRDPSYVPVDLALHICAKDNVFASDVKRQVYRVFHDYFTADNFTFGAPLYSSRIYALVMGIDGVASVEIKRFKRWGKEANQELENGVIETGAQEIIRLENNPSFPENGQIKIDIGGGL
ncbi:MAG: putative baseplate assembly protein [Alphaproteobacteria bacterium]|nr:MAG: putative baseplate assembly protein [Alphaproteobacteria bacterium]